MRDPSSSSLRISDATARLEWKDSDGAEQSIPLKKMETLIGRSNDADVAISNRTVSRHHAKVVRTAGGHLLIDLHSWFGTLVNGNPINYHWLRNGDRIEVGKDHAITLFFSGDPGTPEVDQPAPLEALTDVLAEEHRQMGDKRHLAELELMLAHETQKHLLRHSAPEMEHLVFRAASNPARWVCGDFYNFVPSGDGGVNAVLADVSGRGVAAALLGSMLQGCLEMQLRLGDTLEVATEKLNRFMFEKSHSGDFATMFLFHIDSMGVGSYVSAGHKPAYLFRASAREIRELPSNGRLLGAVPESEFGTTDFELEAGDVLVIYSDGLIEAQNPEEEMFGENRLVEIIRNEAVNGAAHLEYALRETYEDFVAGQAQGDDVTVMIVERKS